MAQLAEQDDEIDVGELFASILNSAWKVVISAIFGAFLFGSFAVFVSTPEYESNVLFELSESSDSASAGQFSGLVAAAGLSVPGQSSAADKLNDRILTRGFVDKIYDIGNFGSDPVMNSFVAEPGLKSRMFAMLLGPRVRQEPTREQLLEGAVGSLSRRMTVSIGDNGFVTLIIRHPVPERAAQIGNLIVDQALKDIEARSRNEIRQTLSYYAEELLNVRHDLDAASAAVRDYAIENNIQSAELLAKTSAQLSQLRTQLLEVDQIVLALNELAAVDQSDFSPEDFAKSNPISSSLEFRRLVNFSAFPSEWKAPSENQLREAQELIRDRKESLENSLQTLQTQARLTGEEAIELSRLEREVAVQSTIYESVITQFETRSLVSGFEQAGGEVLQSALPTSAPSSPSISLFVILGMVLGFLASAALVVFKSFRLGRIHTERTLQYFFSGLSFHILDRRLVPIFRNSKLSRSQFVALQDIASFNLSRSGSVAFVASSRFRLARWTILGLAQVEKRLGRSVVILDAAQAGYLGEYGKDDSQNDSEDLIKFTHPTGIQIAGIKDPISLSKEDVAQGIIDHLRSDYDCVLVACPLVEDGIATTRTFVGICDDAVLLAEKSYTTRRAIEMSRVLLSKAKAAEPVGVVV